MSRRFNYTGRRKLLRSDIQINLRDDSRGQPASFTADLRIPQEMKLDPRARVYVEAYIGSSSMRFDFGTVADVRPPHSCALADIDEGAPVLFRVRIVDESKNVGRVLAAANGIRPQGDGDGTNRKTLLPIRACNLGEEIWQLKFDVDGGFELAVNNCIPDIIGKFKSDPMMAAMVYPEIVRQIALRIWDDESGLPEDADWLANWRAWLEELLGHQVTDNDKIEMDQVADDMARNFASRHRYASSMVVMNGGEDA